jgi:hypothetical protein
MLRKVVGLIVVCVVLVMAVAYFHREEAEDGATAALTPGAVVNPGSVPLDAPEVVRPDVGVAGRRPLPTDAADMGIRPGDPLYPGESDEGIAWLIRNDFPSSLELEMASGRIPLPADVDPADGFTPRELLDLEQLAGQETTRDQALNGLNEAAAMGSMYALEVLGRVYATAPRQNLVWSEAHYRAAQIRGNWAVEFRFKPRLSEENNIIASIMAQQIIDQSNALRARKGMAPLAHDSRPGANAALRTIMENLRNSDYPPRNQ